MSAANMDVRVLMFQKRVTQAELGERLGMGQPEVSVLLKRELGREQKRNIKAIISEIVKERGVEDETVTD